MRQITINKCMNGLIVNVGCQTLVFEDRTKFVLALSKYLENPDQTEKEWLEKFGMDHGNAVQAPATPPPYHDERLRTASEARYVGEAAQTRSY